MRLKKSYLYMGILFLFSLNLLVILRNNFLYCARVASRTREVKPKKNPHPDREQLLDVHDFKYIIPKPPCSRDSSKPFFVTVVHTSPTHLEKRMTARETWAHSDPRSLTYFMMGAVASPSLQKRINREDAKYHDIIQGNFVDSYHNLTYKHTMSLKWFSENCPHVNFLMKIDDDFFANIPTIHEILQKYKDKKKVIMGRYRSPEKVPRSGKWKTTIEQRREDFLPEYTLGGSVIYSNDYVIDAYKKSSTTLFHWVDDVFITGFIRLQLNAKVIPIYEYILSYEDLEPFMSGKTDKKPERNVFMFSGFSDSNDVVKQIRDYWNFTQNYQKN